MSNKREYHLIALMCALSPTMCNKWDFLTTTYQYSQPIQVQNLSSLSLDHVWVFPYGLPTKSLDQVWSTICTHPSVIYEFFSMTYKSHHVYPRGRVPRHICLPKLTRRSPSMIYPMAGIHVL